MPGSHRHCPSGQLDQLLFPGQSLADIVQQVVTIALAAVAVCDGAGLTISDDGRGGRVTGHVGVATSLDPAQYEMDQGPCVVCLETGVSAQYEAGLDDHRWPDFAELARLQGVRTCLAVPLTLTEEAIGAFNLYSRANRAFDERGRQAVIHLAGHAAFIIGNARSFAVATAEVERLQRLLENSKEAIVSHATGVLMARHGHSAQSAVGQLEQEAREQRCSLDDAARGVLASVGQD